MSGVVGVTVAIGVGVVAFVLGMFLPDAQGSRFLDPFEMYLGPAGILVPVYRATSLREANVLVNSR